MVTLTDRPTNRANKAQSSFTKVGKGKAEICNMTPVSPQPAQGLDCTWRMGRNGWWDEDKRRLGRRLQSGLQMIVSRAKNLLWDVRDHIMAKQKLIYASNPFLLTQSSDLGLKVGGTTVHLIAHGALTFSWLFDGGSSLELQTVSMYFWYMRIIYICYLESSSHHTKFNPSIIKWETDGSGSS